MSRQHKALGEAIKAARREKRLTQQQMADALNVSVQSVSQWETGRTKPESDRMREIGKILDKDVDYLLTGVSHWENGRHGAVRQSELDDKYSRMAPILKRDQIFTLNFRFGMFSGYIDDSVLIARDPAVGELYSFEIEDDDNEPLFRIGDFVIFDTEIPFRVGDFVLARDVHNDRFGLRQIRGIRLDDEERSIVDLHCQNPERAPHSMIIDDDDNRIIGTVVEHRRFRRR